MNPAETDALIGLLDRIRKLGITLLLIEHDMNLVMTVSDRITVLNFGTHIAEGAPAEVRHNKDVIVAYLGGSADAA
jgi:ABC-type branched-subunit amino acid transport system ATPase component